MDKKTQDLAWSCLPKEFKEEVEKMWDNDEEPISPTAAYILTELFGIHNLTSDAEEEVMLTVDRKRVQELYAKHKENAKKSTLAGFPDYAEWDKMQCDLLQNLFGSKCLPDNVATSAPNVDSSEPKKNRCEKCGAPNSNICAHMNCQEYISQPEPKLAEPKFHVRQKVKIKGKDYGFEITEIGKWGDSDEYKYKLAGWRHFFRESVLEPFTEPTEESSSNVNHSDIDIDELVVKGYLPDPAKMVDNIIKDGFWKERRLNIAASIAAGWLACHGMTTPETIAMDALAVADALIIEVEKTNNP